MAIRECGRRACCSSGATAGARISARERHGPRRSSSDRGRCRRQSKQRERRDRAPMSAIASACRMRARPCWRQRHTGSRRARCPPRGPAALEEQRSTAYRAAHSCSTPENSGAGGFRPARDRDGAALHGRSGKSLRCQRIFHTPGEGKREGATVICPGLVDSRRRGPAGGRGDETWRQIWTRSVGPER
jgi:hypothetical protein